jgi:hypothetical protein
MAIEAQLFDGTIVEFPDNTDRSVIEKTVKRLTAERQPKEPEPKESVLRQAADIPVNFAKGISQGVRMLSDAFGADNAVSANLRGVEDYLGNLLSAQAKNDQQEIASIFKEAEDKGVLEQVKAGLKAFSVAPVDIMSQAFGTIIPTLAGGLVGRAVGIGARAAGVGTGAVMGTGAGKSAIYDAVTEELKQTGLPPEAIQQAATQAQEYGGKNLDLILANTLLGGVAAGTGIERALIPGMVKNISANVAKRGAIGRGLATGAPELLTEGAQGGTEQFSQNVALQREGFDVPTFRGVGTATTMEAVAGGVLGGGIGAFSRPQTATPPDTGLNVPPPQETPTMDMPAIPQPTPSAPMPLLSADEARQQSYEQQTGRQADLRGGLFQPARGVTAPPMAAPPMDLEAAAQQREQAYQQQMAVQNARQEQAERGNQFMTTPAPYLSQGEAAIQPGQTERAQGLAAQQFGLNANAPRQEFAPQFPSLAAAQQSIDGDRFQQQTPLPQVTPAQALPRVGSPTPTPQTARAFDRQAELLGQMQGLPQVEQTGLAAQADIAGRTGQVDVPQTRFVDLTPMPPRVARQKLAALQADSPNANLNIVPHPQMGGRFAIEERVAPVQEAAEPLREERPSVSYEQAVEMVRNVQRTGVLTPEASAAAQQYGLNIDPMLMNFAERITPENLLVQQRRGMADEAALNAELRGGVATPEEAQRLRETGMGRPYDEVASLEPRAPAELGKGERQRRLEAEAIAEQDAKKTEFFKNLQGPELWLDGFELGINPKSAIQTASPKFTEIFMKPEGRYSLATTASPETKVAAEKFLKEAMPILKRFGLGKVGLRIVDSINNGEADGMYAQQVISLVLDSDNPMGVMRHEVIHALKELGAFTPAEWKVLTKAAKDTWINQFFDRDMQGRYQAEYLKQNGDLEGFQEYLQEEAIAQAFRFFSSPTQKGTPAQRPSGMVANLMRRLNELFKAIRDFFGDKDIPVDEMFLPNRIFADIERGAIQPGRDKGRKEELPQFAAKYSFRPLVDKIEQVAQQSGLPQEMINATTLGMRTGKTGGEAFTKGNLKGIPEVVKFLEDRRLASGLPVLDIANEIDREVLSELLTAEVMAAIEVGGDAISWYDDTINKTIAMAALQHPELKTDKNAQMAYKLAVAISSQTMNVEDNIKFADKVYTSYKKNKKFPEIGTGKSGGSMVDNYKLANTLLATMGEDRLREFLATPYTVGELRSAGLNITSENADEMVLGSSVFGPKIGFGFYSNLSGNFEPVTMDMWFMRLIGRLTGKLRAFDEKKLNNQIGKLRSTLDVRGTNGLYADQLDLDLVERAKTDQEAAVELSRAITKLHEKDYKNNRADFNAKTRIKTPMVNAAQSILITADKPIDAPASGTQRQQLRKVVDLTRQKVKELYGSDIPPASMQALVWYPEQELYKSQGVKLRVTSQDYAGGIKKVLLEKGYDERAIDAAAKQGSRSAQRVAKQPVSGQAAGASQQPSKAVRKKELLDQVRKENVLAGREIPAEGLETFFAQPDVRAETQNITGEVIPSTAGEMSQIAGLNRKDKQALNSTILKQRVIQKLAESLGIKSIIRVRAGTGGYDQAISPNLIVNVVNKDVLQSKKDADILSDAMSYVFQQDATPYFRADRSLLGAGKMGFKIKFADENPSATLEAKTFKLLQKVLGADAGYTKMNKNEFVIINYDGKNNDGFSRNVEQFITELEALTPIAEKEVFGANTEYEFYDWSKPDTQKALASRIQGSVTRQPNIQKRLNDYRKSFVSIAREAVSKAGEKPRFSLRDFGSSQSALRPSLSSDAGISFNPVKEDAVSFQGSHYGKARTEVLNGAKYGQGLKGAEARRLEQSDDERIKRRVYFYIPRGNNTMPNREAGVGSYVYTQKLDNILAPGPTMGRLNKEAGGDANKFESLIVDNGYDGYAVPDFGMMVVMNQDVPANYEGTVDEVHGGKKFSLRAPTTPEFKRFFKDSKVVDEKGQPLVMYHGTTYDFDVFKSNRGELIYFSKDPEVASNFAESQATDNDTDGGENIVPAYLSAKNIFDPSNPDHLAKISRSTARTELKNGMWDAIERHQRLIKDAGFDGVYVKETPATDATDRDIAVFSSKQIKSATGNRGTFDATNPDIRFSLRAPKTPEFKRFFGNSKVTNPDGTPKVMYHGTARIIDEFLPKQAGAIFVTDNPDFAESFSEDSLQFMVTEQRQLLGKKFADMSPDDQLQLLKKGYKLGVKQKALTKADANKALEAISEDFANRKYPTNTDFNNVAEFFDEEIKSKLESGQNIMPLYVRAENPFDYENPKHIEALQAQANNEGLFPSSLPDDLKRGSWKSIESNRVQELIKEAGFDGFYVKEGGNKNLAVYNPNQIKSAIGNRGTYDETGRILYSLKNAPPNRYTKMTDDPTLGKTIAKVTESTLNVVRNDASRTSSRIQFIDTSAGLTKTLSSMPLFDTNGTLRADMLHHSKANVQNIISTGLVSGNPVLNDDGTIIIERTENNLARSLHIADSLNNNPNVLASGLSGKELIAEVARGLRGADILAEDAETRKLGERQIAEVQRMTAELAANKNTMTPQQIAKDQKAINKKRKEGNENRKVNRELQVKPEDIAWAKKQLDLIPEVQEVLDIWNSVNTALVTLQEETGMIDKETADKYRSNKNYVPLFKSREDLDDSAFFRGSGTKSTPKQKALKGADITRNIWENIYKQYAMMTAAAYENQTRRVSVEQMRSISEDLAVITTPNDKRVNLRYRDKGKDVDVIIENPNDLAAFQSMTYQISPVMKFLGGFTSVLRAGALLNPMFWIRELVRNPIQATITGQSGIVTPFHSMKEFLLISGSPEARLLAERGVLGKIYNDQSLNDYLENVGTATQIAPNMIQKTYRRLMKIHEAADAATRVAIFKKAKAKAIKDGLSEPQATDLAVMKAREYINFSVMGNSPTLANLRQMIPFMNATIVGLDALYRAYTGVGLNPEERAKVRRTFRIRATMMVAMSVAYAISLQDDDDYQRLPDYVKDNNMLFPIGFGENKRFLKFSIPYEVGFLFKTMPELLVRYLAGNSTGKEVLASLRAGFIQNMPSGGTPVPQFIKPVLEVVTNKSFFNMRPIEGIGDSRLPVAQRGDKASEFAKMMSGLGLDKILLSPAKIDVLTKGYFAEFGAFFNELTDAFIATTSGKEKTPRNIQNLPFMKAFLTDPQVNKAISDFYDIENNATQVANLFSKYKSEGQGEMLREMIADPEKLKQVGGAPVMRRISRAMSDIQKAIRIIDKNQEMSPEERRARINELQQQLGVLAERGKQVADTMGLSR